MATDQPGPGETLWRVRLLAILIVFDIAGFRLVVGLLPFPFGPVLRLHIFLAVVVAVTTSLVAFPIIRYLDTGWQVRYDEIRNKLSDGRLADYLRQFHRTRVTAAAGVLSSERHPKLTPLRPTRCLRRFTKNSTAAAPLSFRSRCWSSRSSSKPCWSCWCSAVC